MATRLYLQSGETPPITPAYGSNWDNTTTAIRSTADTTKQSTTMTTISKDGDGDAADTDHLYLQFTGPALAAQTLAAQSVKLQMRLMEENARANQYMALEVRVHQSDGSLRGTLFSLTRDTTELATSLTNRGMSGTTSELEVYDGDYPVVEIGTGGDPATGAGGNSHDGDLRYGDASASDLPENDTSTDDYNPWVEFAGDWSWYSAGSSSVPAMMQHYRQQR